MILEICIDSVESALAAQEGGATRVELCADLDRGGTTPDPHVIEAVRARISIALHVMIRPRTGDFCYSDQECDAMRRQMEQARSLNVDGVVFGLLTDRGEVDVVRMRRLLESARPLSVTFHRAFDETVNLRRGLDDLKTLGVDRILTSGGQGNIIQNAALLGELVHKSGGRPSIMAGGGVNFQNVEQIVNSSNVNEVHTLSAVMKDGSDISPASIPSSFSGNVVDAEKVKRMIRLLRDRSAHSQT